MFFLLLAHLHLIGVQPWCNLDPKTKVMQCNYEDRGSCEAYRESSEVCVPNPNVKR